MHLSRILLATAGLSLIASPIVLANQKPTPRPEFKTRVVATGLQSPRGIVVGRDDEVYFTEVPTPGVAGGLNGVKVLDVRKGKISTVNTGEPEPVDITMGEDGTLYWTCRTAGVILQRNPDCSVSPLLTGLDRPTGITADLFGNIFFTEVPEPGMGGGTNTVNVDHGDAERILNVGDPEPTDIAVAFGGTVYWTCTSAGVIVSRDRLGNVEVLLSGLDKPMGIALNRNRDRLYWTEVPTPGVSGADGGTNEVWEYNLRNGRTTLVNAGDPYPADVTVARDGTVYWTCTSAGVIVEARRTRGHP
ncbi:hypothetical protein ASA1KI_41360 [Opitutales bacterium ASA1]|uniref:Vgb family protein n=1 Tax=Congregicoccus parvus TaxID=3081749 RepID=UPI002B325452|nr:hypothetical protein ASA1KI_41360 [Opitutales bacterium ASA1]